ncbi:hypothetical protein NRS6186_20205 [Bacillus subtilis]|nr:hypothetical protein BSn5_09690 [Bacillus subtilis BSn5]OAZ70143.1 hypothetical protein SRCM101280_01748 [Bacillus subtilis]TDO87147.1 hypothetical protein BDW29_2995 [Bacillus sp. AtDRG31]CAF1729195.1 hypothetical protein NRS6110_00373 [Bacillus subtilis]CAF1733623.1 hypothetical protein NRS6111_00662 [Bacillus subtilis]
MNTTGFHRLFFFVKYTIGTKVLFFESLNIITY